MSRRLMSHPLRGRSLVGDSSVELTTSTSQPLTPPPLTDQVDGPSTELTNLNGMERPPGGQFTSRWRKRREKAPKEIGNCESCVKFHREPALIPAVPIW